MEPKTPSPQMDNDKQPNEADQPKTSPMGIEASKPEGAAVENTGQVVFTPDSEGAPTLDDETVKKDEAITKPGTPENGDTELDPTLPAALPASEPSISEADDKPSISQTADTLTAATDNEGTPPAPAPAPVVSPDVSGDTSPMAPGGTVNPDTTSSDLGEVPMAAAMPTVSSSAASASDSGKNGKKKLGLLLTIVTILIVLLGASAAAYFGYILPNKPENVLKIGLANTFFSEDIKSASFNGDFDFKEKDSSQGTMRGSFEGYSSQGGAVQLTAELDAIITKVSAEFRSPDGKNLYFKIGGLNGLPQLIGGSSDPNAAVYGSLIESVNDQWYEISQSFLETMTGTKVDFSQQLSEEDARKIADAYLKHEFLVIKETLPSQKIEGKDSYHYRIGVDKQKLYDFMVEIDKAKIKDFDLKDSDLESIKKADLSNTTAEVWISKDDKLIRQVTFKVEENGDVANMRMTFTKFNETQTVEKPAGAKSILELLGGLAGGAGTLPLTEMDESGISL